MIRFGGQTLITIARLIFRRFLRHRLFEDLVECGVLQMGGRVHLAGAAAHVLAQLSSRPRYIAVIPGRSSSRLMIWRAMASLRRCKHLRNRTASGRRLPASQHLVTCLRVSMPKPVQLVRGGQSLT
jgi:hypothetical protein